MLKIWLALCLNIFCVFLVPQAAVIDEPHISFNTLKSDLELILEDPDSETVNIQYVEDAVLHLEVGANPQGQRYVRIDDFVSVKYADGSVIEMSGLVFANGSFGFESGLEESLFFIVKKKPGLDIKPAKRTMTYTTIEELTDDLDLAKRGHIWTNVGFMFICSDFTIGRTTIPLLNDLQSEYLMLTKPLKGIRIYGPETLVEKFFNRWYEPSHLPECGCLETVEFDGKLKCSPSIRDHIFFDVWYKHPLGSANRAYGSSSSSLNMCVQAVRVFDEWPSHVEALKAGKISHDKRGENIRRINFEEDMHTAQMRLERFTNVLISYADDIVVEVRAVKDKNDQLIVMGTTKADSRGIGPLNVRAVYDSEGLEYSDQSISTDEFIPNNLGDKSSYLKYTEWEKFESDLKAIWKAMQTGCLSGKQFYEFSIVYGDGIQVKYDCQNEKVVLDDTILILTEGPNLDKAVVTQCKTLEYLRNQKIETPCLDGGVKAIAIQEYPADLWVGFKEPVHIDAGIFKEELNIMKETLLKNDHLRNTESVDGAIILDESMLFEMKLHPDEYKRYVEIHGNFKHASMDIYYKSLLFNGDVVVMESDVMKLDNVFTLQKDAPFDSKFEREFVISSKHITIEELKQYFNRVSDEALKRCPFLKTKTFTFKLVFHHKFAFDGLYSCPEMVLRVTGDFKALILIDRIGRTEVQPDHLDGYLIYVAKDNMFITKRGSLNDVFAISIPEVTTDITNFRKLFGAPIPIDKYSMLLLKSIKH